MQPVDDGRRQTLVDDVHDAGGRTAAIQQRRWPFQDLDLIGVRRINRDRMVGAHVGRIHRRDAVLQYLDARPSLPSDDRTAGTRTEVRGGYAGLILQRVANRAAPNTVELFSADDLGGPHELVRGSTQWTRSYDDLFDLLVVSQCVARRERTGDRQRTHVNPCHLNRPLKLLHDGPLMEMSSRYGHKPGAIRGTLGVRGLRGGEGRLNNCDGDLCDLRNHFERDRRRGHIRRRRWACRMTDCLTDLAGGTVRMLRQVRHVCQTDRLRDDESEAEHQRALAPPIELRA